eukprot:NODE_164_length_16443_cov_0.166544.p11 type:complete len:110 gc:universal NODE_164_length_16443_cov_0.166544:6268-5939(-)
MGNDLDAILTFEWNEYPLGFRDENLLELNKLVDDVGEITEICADVGEEIVMHCKLMMARFLIPFKSDVKREEKIKYMMKTYRRDSEEKKKLRNFLKSWIDVRNSNRNGW